MVDRETLVSDALTADSSVTASETIIVLVAAVWLTVGLFVDGYAHEHLLSGGESFLTPWHVLFYSGFTAAAMAIGRIVYRRVGSGPLWDCVPFGYRIGVAGLGVFAVGGIGDALWHSRFGFEKGTEALYSPSHLLLFVGLVAIVTCPYRSTSQHARGASASWATFWPAALSMMLAISVVAFFSPWAFYSDTWYRVAYDAATNAGDTEVNAALGAELVTTMVLIGAVLFVLRDWRPPQGTFALVFTSAAAVFWVAIGGPAVAVMAAFLGGITIDVVLAPLHDTARPCRNRLARLYTANMCGAAVIWSSLHLLLFASGDLAWSAPLAAGTPALCALLAGGLTALANPAVEHSSLR